MRYKIQPQASACDKKAIGGTGVSPGRGKNSLKVNYDFKGGELHLSSEMLPLRKATRTNPASS